MVKLAKTIVSTTPEVKTPVNGNGKEAEIVKFLKCYKESTDRIEFIKKLQMFDMFKDIKNDLEKIELRAKAKLSTCKAKMPQLNIPSFKNRGWVSAAGKKQIQYGTICTELKDLFSAIQDLQTA